jgi:hypothetical protein
MMYQNGEQPRKHKFCNDNQLVFNLILNKMKIKSIFPLVAAVMALTSSCIKDQLGPDPAPEGNIVVDMRIQPGGVSTRSIGPSVGVNTLVTVNSGIALFTDKSGVVIKAITLTDEENTRLNSGVQFTNIPIMATSAWFIGNPPLNITEASVMGKNVNSLTVDVASQHSGGGTDNVTLFGGGKELTQKNGANYETTFNVQPVVSRIEISPDAIRGFLSTDLSKSISFRLKGIFIDSYYNEMNIDGTFDNSKLAVNGSAVEKYRLNGVDPITGQRGSYNDELDGVVYDFATSGALSPPTGNDVWAYNLLTPVADGATMPTIVIYMTQVEINGVALAGNYYLTINKYYKDGNSANQFTKFSQGTVYAISNIKFTENDIAPAPYATSKNAVMKVNVLKWARENTGVGYVN